MDLKKIWCVVIDWIRLAYVSDPAAGCCEKGNGHAIKDEKFFISLANFSF
jgi:hypothetical protein